LRAGGEKVDVVAAFANRPAFAVGETNATIVSLPAHR